MITLALLLAALHGTPADEFGEQLARLAAPRASERAAAERWLQAHLVFERYPELAEAALAGDAEVRGRLARVLASDARHLTLALELCNEDEAALKELGLEAVRAGVAQADPRLAEPGLRGDAQGFESFLRRAATKSPARELRLDARLPLEQMVELLELAGELPVGLTLDASLATRTFRRGETLPPAPWNELLWRLRSIGVEIECHGLERGRAAEDPAGAFVRLTAGPGPARTGVELVGEWLLALSGGGDELARVRAARNLAASGFTPAIGWMEHLVRTRADPAAREGLLWAAARGRVAPVLRSAEVLEPLLAEAESGGGPRSARILCALAHSGCVDERGTALAPRLLGGFEGASARARWTRLFLLERNGCASSELDARARALLADAAAPAALRLQALHALAAQPGAAGGAPEVERMAEFFRLELDADELERLTRALARLDLEPPYRDPADIPSDWSTRERLRLLEAWLRRGELEPLAAHVAAWMQVAPDAEGARGEELADELWIRCARGDREQVERALLRAQELAPAKAVALERVRLLLGLVPAAEVARALERGGHALDGERIDLALVSALAGYPVSIRAAGAARESLLGALRAALKGTPSSIETEELLEALERAAQGLYAAGRDREGDSFAGLVRQALLRTPPSVLKDQLDRPSWPPAPFVERRDLARALARFEIPAGLGD